MPFLIGTDEAGYSPNLGPLVISASVWWLDDGDVDLYKRLKSVLCKEPSRKAPLRRLAIADSKALYSTAQGLGCLERGVLAALGLLNDSPENWLGVWQRLAPCAVDNLPSLPWHAEYELPVPLAADGDELATLIPKLAKAFERAGVRLVALKSRAVFPDEFNRATLEYGNKAEALSRITLELLAQALELCGDQPVLAVGDKHGGRNQYSRLLQQQFPDVLIEVHGESLLESIYRWGPEGSRIDLRFKAGGESFLPVALASMASKYLRELSMRAFNDFWCGRVENLAPTAGYPVDARRFMAAIQGVQAELGINRAVLWRER